MSEIMKNEEMEVEVPEELVKNEAPETAEEMQIDKGTQDLADLMAVSKELQEGEEESKSEKSELEDRLQKALKECGIPKAIIQEDKIPGRRDAYYIDDDLNHIHNAVTPEEKKRLEWAQVKRIAQRKDLVDCRVMGVSRIGDAVYFITSIKGFKTVILAEDFFLPGTFDESFETAPREEQLRRYQQMGQRMFGAWVKVIITYAVSSYKDRTINYIVRANRVYASEVMKHLFFFDDSEMAKRRQVRVGSNVTVHVLASAPHRLRVESCGVEVLVGFRELSTRQVVTEENCNSLFPKDETIYMKVMKLEKNPETKTVEMELSHVAIEAENYNMEISSDMIGQKYLGIVTMVTQKYYIALIEITGARCLIPRGRCYDMNRLCVNDKIAINVTSLTEDGTMLVGECRRV